MKENYADISISAFETALRTLASGAVTFVPKFLVAVIAFIVMWIVGVQIGKLVEQVIRSLKLDNLLESLGADEPVSRAGYKLNSGVFLGGIVRWFFIILGFLIASEVVGLEGVSAFLRQAVITYIPNVIVAAIVIIIGALLADIIQKVIRGSVSAAGLPAASFIGSFAKWAIWVFAIVIALDQLQVAEQIVRIFQIVVTAFFAMLALAGGLAFGLGGKEHASAFLDRMKKEMK